jgi:hypothetical protein
LGFGFFAGGGGGPSATAAILERVRPDNCCFFLAMRA